MTTHSSRPNRTDLGNVGNEGERREPAPLSPEAGARAELEVLRDVLIDRLSQRSDDFDATRDLRVVYSRLRETSYGKQTVTTSS